MAAHAAGRDDDDDHDVEHDADHGGAHADALAAGDGAQRLDKWLWFVRAIKSRTQAAGLVTDGKVRVNRERVDKPSHALRPGDIVTVSIRGRVRVLKMLAPGNRRGPPTQARMLYEDLTPPPIPVDRATVAAPDAHREPGQGRPTKKERRQIDRFKEEQ